MVTRRYMFTARCKSCIAYSCIKIHRYVHGKWLQVCVILQCQDISMRNGRRQYHYYIHLQTARSHVLMWRRAIHTYALATNEMIARGAGGLVTGQGRTAWPRPLPRTLRPTNHRGLINKLKTYSRQLGPDPSPPSHLTSLPLSLPPSLPHSLTPSLPSTHPSSSRWTCTLHH